MFKNCKSRVTIMLVIHIGIPTYLPTYCFDRFYTIFQKIKVTNYIPIEKRQLFLFRSGMDNDHSPRECTPFFDIQVRNRYYQNFEINN